CFWNAQTGCDCVRVRKFYGSFLSGVERADDRRATDSLYCEHPWPLSPDPAERFQFIECFPHSDEARAAAGGIKNGVGQLPVALLCLFVAERLCRFDAIRPCQCGRGELSF